MHFSKIYGPKSIFNAFDHANKTNGVYKLTPTYTMANVFQEVMTEGALIYTVYDNIKQPNVAAVLRKSLKRIHYKKKPGYNYSYANGLLVRIGQPWERDFGMFLG